MALSSKLGHFNLLEEIAHGGMGTVYRGFDPTLNREGVAIKVLREDLAKDPEVPQRLFLQEARFRRRDQPSAYRPDLFRRRRVGRVSTIS